MIMPKMIQDNTLDTREYTIGHWKFRDFTSEIGNYTLLPRSNFILSEDFVAGYTENDITAIDLDGTKNQGVYIEFPSATAFNFTADQGFTIEVIVRISSSSPAATRPLIYKWDASNKGYRFGLTSDGRLRTQIGDGTTSVFGSGSTVVKDGVYHHLVMVVDRVNAEISTYIDGVIDIDAASILAVTGDLNPDSDIIIGYDPDDAASIIATIDEVCITKEIMTISAIADRSAGQLKIASSRIDGFLLQYFPAIHHGNADFRNFLIPFCESFLDAKAYVDDLKLLIGYDTVPDELLPHLASNVGFELPEADILNEYKRRLFVQIALNLYQLKGKETTIESIAVMLGFYPAALTETFQYYLQFIINMHRLYQRSFVVTELFADDFASGLLLQWDDQEVNNDIIRVLAGKLDWIGGTPSGSELNVLTFDDTSDYVYMSMKFDEQSDSSGTEFAMLLAYTDYNDYVYVKLYYSASHWYLAVGKVVAGTPTVFATLNDVETIIANMEDEHTLWCRANMTTLATSVFTIGIDDVTLIAEQSGDISGFSFNKKGIYNKENTHMKYDDVLLQEFTDYLSGAVLWNSSFENRSIELEVYGTPPNKDERVAYLKKILPQHVPLGVDITVTAIA